MLQKLIDIKTRHREMNYLMLCVISGIAMRLVFAPYHCFIIVIPAFLIFFYAVERSKYPFICGFIYGCTKAITISFWLLETLTNHYQLYLLLAWLLFLSVVVVPHGIWMGLVVKIAKYPITLLVNTKNIIIAVFFSALTASIFTTIEWLRINISPENSWGFFPAALVNIPGLHGLAGYIGGVGLHFVVILCCLIFFWGIKNIPIFFKAATVAFFIIILTFVIGVMSLPNNKGSSGNEIEIALIHPVINQKQRWNSEFNQQTLAIYRQMSLLAFDDGDSENTRLIIWPETAITSGVENSVLAKKVIREITQKTGAWLLTGSPAFIGKGESRRIYNSAFLYSPDGEAAGRYDKNFLLPFAERKYALFSLGGYQQSQFYHKGENALPITFRDIGRDISLATMICYEIGMPKLSHDIISQQSSLIVNISNDAWFGNSSESEQQLDMLILRSAEYGLPAIRSTGYGVAAIIDNARVVKKSDIESKSIIKGVINLRSYRPTLWARFPNWPIIITVGIILIYFIVRAFGISHIWVDYPIKSNDM